MLGELSARGAAQERTPRKSAAAVRRHTRDKILGAPAGPTTDFLRLIKDERRELIPYRAARARGAPALVAKSGGTSRGGNSDEVQL
jgi:hypothetical protein